MFEVEVSVVEDFVLVVLVVVSDSVVDSDSVFEDRVFEELDFLVVVAVSESVFVAGIVVNSTADFPEALTATVVAKFEAEPHPY